MLSKSPERYILARIVVGGPCWEWVGSFYGNGYGLVSYNRRRLMAHRFAYETFVGPIPDGLQLDHVCRNKACVFPNHLEPVTNRENTIRSLAARRDTKTHCPVGHELTADNTYTRKAHPLSKCCRTCERERGRAYYWAKLKSKRQADRSSLSIKEI